MAKIIPKYEVVMNKSSEQKNSDSNSDQINSAGMHFENEFVKNLNKSAWQLSVNDLAHFMNKDLNKLKNELMTFFSLNSLPSYLPPELVREYLENQGFTYPQKIVSVQMLKGGVAKTTTVLNLGIRAAMYGAKVLFVDLDQQANLSFSLGIEDENLPVWLDIYEKKKTVNEVIIKINDHIDLIPSSLNNSVLERVMINSNRNWSSSIKTAIEQIKLNYDLIIIDTAPALSATNTAITVASDEVIMPINPDKFAILGFEKNRLEFEDIKKDFQLSVDFKVLFTKFDGRERMSAEYLNQFIEKYPKNLMKNYIRVSSEAKNTLGTTKSIFSTKSTVKEDYDLCALELLQWL